MTDRPEHRDELLGLYQRMVLIRCAEERLGEVAALGKLPAGVHLSNGQEATAVGVCAQLHERDWITSTHRGHGHFLAKGGSIAQMFAEIWGKRTGICRGMGGDMHVADLSKGILGANGIVGGGFAIAAGAALACQLSGEGRIVVCFFGDGAANQGVFMESLNIASIWKLPVIFVCENNQVSEFTISSRVTAGALTDRARALQVPGVVVDGNDVLAVERATRDAADRCRRGEGPSYIEALTYRQRGHSGGEELELYLNDRQYRTQEQVNAWKSPDRDPISRFRTYLTSREICDDVQLSAIEASVRTKVDEAVEFAETSEEADPDLAFRLMAITRHTGVA